MRCIQCISFIDCSRSSNMIVCEDFYPNKHAEKERVRELIDELLSIVDSDELIQLINNRSRKNK